MVIRKEKGDYIWITWLAKLLSGETVCEWQYWFKAHFSEALSNPIVQEVQYIWYKRNTSSILPKLDKKRNSSSMNKLGDIVLK